MLALALLLRGPIELPRAHPTATVARASITAPARHTKDGLIKAATSTSVPRPGTVAGRARSERLIPADPGKSLRVHQSKPPVI